MRVIEHLREMQIWSEAQRREGKRIVLVPTMGFLHEGHLSLVREGRRRGDGLVVSLFVNPKQFAPHEDYATYPHGLERDRELLEKEGVEILFYPSAAEMYPLGYQTYVEMEGMGSLLCGAFRPGHFRGVATVVAKLFNIVRPHVAIFGLKDYQQLQIVRRMVEDLNLDIEVVGCPIVREKDGLAMSSRNAYLSQKEREAALSLYRSLRKAESMVEEGERESQRIIQAVRAEMDKEPLVRVEYVQLCHPGTLEEVKKIDDEAVLALAVWIGKARLIDNAMLKP
ncbi:MAG: pantoate--beta-alanine ligase [Deltaproteobacteria bacterium]|nr:pantoate--beta-alanine ligase [Deltaproteobacteria bacterium]